MLNPTLAFYAYAGSEEEEVNPLPCFASSPGSPSDELLPPRAIPVDLRITEDAAEIIASTTEAVVVGQVEQIGRAATKGVVEALPPALSGWVALVLYLILKSKLVRWFPRK